MTGVGSHPRTNLFLRALANLPSNAFLRRAILFAKLAFTWDVLSD
jgi:hypothetical protein